MIKIRKSSERGHADHRWLSSKHTFSFADYQDPEHMGFRVLRVINEDRVAAGQGFGTHPHKDMEIISYVVSGELEHKDSMGNGSTIKPGEFQIISAGTGITHSEFNPSSEKEVHFYQIWIVPQTTGLAPSYQQRSFELNHDKDKQLQLVASKDALDGSLSIHQDVKLYHVRLSMERTLDLPLSKNRHAWIQVISGSVLAEEFTLSAGDGVAISNLNSLQVTTDLEAEILFFDLP